jgi:hypothetical protein
MKENNTQSAVDLRCEHKIRLGAKEAAEKKRRRKTTQAAKATPHIIKEKEPLWYRVP